MFITPLVFGALVTLFNGILSKSVELTFELPDSAVECFYQEIEKNTSASLEYQVQLISVFIYCNLLVTALLLDQKIVVFVKKL